jgi:hypothetical protein
VECRNTLGLQMKIGEELEVLADLEYEAFLPNLTAKYLEQKDQLAWSTLETNAADGGDGKFVVEVGISAGDIGRSSAVEFETVVVVVVVAAVVAAAVVASRLVRKRMDSILHLLLGSECCCYDGTSLHYCLKVSRCAD